MTTPLRSPVWYRVADLRPRLREHARIHRHQYRGQTWYVLQNRASGHFHRFSPETHRIVGLMDGRRTMQQLWEAAVEQLGDKAPTQDDLLRLLAQLHEAEVLQADATPDIDGTLARRRRQRRGWVQLLHLLSWKIPLVDPDAWLRRLAPVVRPFLGVTGVLLWCAAVFPALVLLAMHWRDLTHDAADHFVSVQNVAVLWALFPVLKLLHELGHAAVTRAFGGEVHELGLTFLLFTPVPYVDASSSWGFPEKWRRIAVGAAGMAVELAVAAGATYVWLLTESGVIRAAAFSTIFIAGLSTVLVNANPFLRFDGYYMLADWLETPNLAPRARGYIGYLCQRYVLGRRGADVPEATAGERVWFLAYAVASCVCRIAAVIAVTVALAHVSVWLAAAFVAVATAGMVAIPAVRGVAFLVASPLLRGVRGRAVAIAAAGVVTVLYVLAVAPVPYRSRAEGVIWVPEEALLRSEVEGFVQRVLVPPGRRVEKGDALLQLRDAAIDARIEELEARRRELLRRHDEQYSSDRLAVQVLRQEIAYVEQSLADARQRARELTVRAPVPGTFVAATPEDLAGRLVKQGELLAYIVEVDRVTVRTVVAQGDIDLVRHRTLDVQVRLAERLSQPVPGTVRRVVPTASERLPATALGTEGGGALPIDPRDTRGVTALGRVFQLDIELPNTSRHVNVGGRAYVRFDHGHLPLAHQGYRRLRQLLLARWDA